MEEDLYEFSTSGLLDVIQGFDNKYNSVMIFGHNPAFTTLNNNLTDQYIDNIPTCGIVSIEFDMPWNQIDSNSGKTQFFIYPKMYSSQ